MYIYAYIGSYRYDLSIACHIIALSIRRIGQWNKRKTDLGALPQLICLFNAPHNSIHCHKISFRLSQRRERERERTTNLWVLIENALNGKFAVPSMA